MEEKNFIIEKIRKSSEKTMYIFFNLSKRIGIRRMRSLFDDSNIEVGTIVLINGEKYILSTIFNFKDGEMISYNKPF